MALRDLHTHTVYSDGKNTAEEMVLAAIRLGLTEIGISDHSYTAFDTHYCMQKTDIPRYKAEIRALREKYADKISVLCSIEEDLYAEERADDYDYAIGSAHYVRANGNYYSLDEDRNAFISICHDHFGGDYAALSEAYYSALTTFADRTDISIIGHLDLITKFNEGGSLFSEEDPRYQQAARNCLRTLVAAGKTIEINTGAVARGYRRTPYPSRPLFTYAKELGARFILSSDAHSIDKIGFGFDTFSDYTK